MPRGVEVQKFVEIEPIELYDLHDALRKRFNFKRPGPFPLFLINVAQPVYEISEFIEEIKIDNLGSISRAAVDGAGQIVAVTIPDGERWDIYAMRLIRTAGDGTLTYLFVVDPDVGVTIPIYSQGASSGLDTELLNPPVRLDSGQQVKAYVNAITADSSWNVYAYYRKRKV